MSIKTGITRVDEDDIVVRGRRLAQEVVGRTSFTDFFFLHATGRQPSPAESALFEALLVNSMDHGINHPVLVARLTLGVAPEAIQGAIAAGILGVGRVADGAIELVAERLYKLAGEIDAGVAETEAIARFLAACEEEGRPVPGLGHPLHKRADPRVDRLFELAGQHGFSMRYVGLMQALARAVSQRKGRDIPVNGAGAVAALYCELGFPPAIAKAATIVSLSAGVTGHLMEELRRPTARAIRRVVAGAVEFEEQ